MNPLNANGEFAIVLVPLEEVRLSKTPKLTAAKKHDIAKNKKMKM